MNKYKHDLFIYYFRVFESIFNILKLTVDQMALFEIHTDIVFFVSVFWFSGWELYCFTLLKWIQCCVKFYLPHKDGNDRVSQYVTAM